MKSDIEQTITSSCKPVAPANQRQVGGSHYQQGGEQHWDRMWRLHGRGYFVGCATKYLERYHLKNGVQDLEKARHFIDKLIELESAAVETAEDFYAQQERAQSMRNTGA